MYEPSAGRILVDGQDLARMPAADWRARLAGAFQDFFRFEFPAQRTVGVGDVPRLDERPAVETAVDRAGAEDVVHTLTDGLDTQLGPTWPNGVEVSFGQWQKLSLARGFMRDGPLLLVLDEPTAALDAETEHALFERYANAARGNGTSGANGRITLLVSHRFSTVRMADLIVVLDGARWWKWAATRSCWRRLDTTRAVRDPGGGLSVVGLPLVPNHRSSSSSYLLDALDMLDSRRLSLRTARAAPRAARSARPRPPRQSACDSPNASNGTPPASPLGYLVGT